MSTQVKSTARFDVRAQRLRRYVEQAIADQYALRDARRRIEQLEQLIQEYHAHVSEAEQCNLGAHARALGIKLS